MCGIIGFTGKLKAQDVLLTGLASLEYRDMTVRELRTLKIPEKFHFGKLSEK